jgi:hypothetical protein
MKPALFNSVTCRVQKVLSGKNPEKIRVICPLLKLGYPNRPDFFR